MSSGRRRWLFLAIMWIGTTLVVAALALGYYLQRGRAIPRSALRVTGDWLLEPDDEIGYVAMRNGTTEFRQLDSGLRYHVSTDARRARVRRPGDQTPDHVDVVAVGCSFTWGYGVEAEDTFVERLGGLLGATTANFGMGGYGTIQSLQILRRNVDLRPRVVVYGMITDHLLRNVSPCAPSISPYCIPVPYFERNAAGGAIHPPRFELFSPDASRRFHLEVLTRDGDSLVDRLLAAKWAFFSDVFRWVPSREIRGDESPQNVVDALRFGLSEMGRTARAAGARLVVLYVPSLLPTSMRSPPVELREAASESQADFVDMTPVLAAQLADPASPPLVVADGSHPSPLAHRLIAERLAAFLRSGS